MNDIKKFKQDLEEVQKTIDISKEDLMKCIKEYYGLSISDDSYMKVKVGDQATVMDYDINYFK